MATALPIILCVATVVKDVGKGIVVSPDRNVVQWIHVGRGVCG